MTQDALTKEDLQQFKAELIEDIKNLFHVRTTEQKLWLRTSEVREMLNISAGTLQNLRINGQLKCSRVGGIIYYDYRDIEKMSTAIRREGTCACYNYD